MKKLIKAISICLCVVVLLQLAACADPTPTQNTMSVVFSEKFLNVAEVSPESWIESLNNLGAEQYQSLYVNNDGESVTLEITDEQRTFWISAVDRGLEKLETDFSSIDSSYGIDYTDDYRNIDFSYDLDLPATEALYYVIFCEVYCAFGQMLCGEAADHWLVEFTIYNANTGKVVTSGNSNTGLSYETADWEASE